MFSPGYLFIQSCIYICVDSCIFLLYLGYNPIFYFIAQIIPGLLLEGSCFIWFLCQLILFFMLVLYPVTC